VKVVVGGSRGWTSKGSDGCVGKCMIVFFLSPVVAFFSIGVSVGFKANGALVFKYDRVDGLVWVRV
jgi:hypothetical protein